MPSSSEKMKHRSPFGTGKGAIRPRPATKSVAWNSLLVKRPYLAFKCLRYATSRWKVSRQA